MIPPEIDIKAALKRLAPDAKYTIICNPEGFRRVEFEGERPGPTNAEIIEAHNAHLEAVRKIEESRLLAQTRYDAARKVIAGIDCENFPEEPAALRAILKNVIQVMRGGF